LEHSESSRARECETINDELNGVKAKYNTTINMPAVGQKNRNVRWPHRINARKKYGEDKQTKTDNRLLFRAFRYGGDQRMIFVLDVQN